MQCENSQAQKWPPFSTYLGPYENWVFETGKAYGYPGLLPDENVALSLFLELESPLPTGPFSGLKVPQSPFHLYFPILWNPTGGYATEFFPFLFYDPARATGLFDMFQALIDSYQSVVDLPDNSPEISNWLRSNRPSEVRLNQPLRGETLNLCWEDRKPLPEPSGEKVVIVAIIDDGIPFAHRNFLDSEGKTRIDYCWSQSATSNGNPLLFGREYTAEHIDEMIADSLGDEGAIYRAAGLANNPDPRLRFPLDRMYSHGAHVLDTLAGSWPTDTETQVRIIAVDLPAMASWDTSGFGKDMATLSALHYIFDRADKIGAANGQTSVPLVLNMSYGHSAGAHDGSNQIEAAFDEIIKKRREIGHPTALIMPSGNMYLDRVHSVLNRHHYDKVGRDYIDQTWFLPPGDRTSSFVEIWLPANLDTKDITVELLGPDGLQLAYPGPTDKGHYPIEHNGSVIGQFSVEKYRNLRWRYVIALAPTETIGLEQFDATVVPPSPAAPAGRWRIRLILNLQAGKSLEEYTGPIGAYIAGGLQCWIQRDVDYNQAYSGALQSHFIDPFDELYDDDGGPMMRDPTWRDTRTRRFGTLNGMATARSALVVGGHVASECEAAFYSSAGALRHETPGRPGVIQVGKQVGLSGASERSPFHRGIIAAGTRSGVTVAQRGTSSAAPQAARQLALRFLENGINPIPADNYLSLLCRADNDCNDPLPGPFPHQSFRLGACLLSLQRKHKNKD